MPYREEEDYESMSMDDGNCGPGPGEARGQSAVGYQTTSNRRSNHGFGFGTSVRGPMQQSVDTVPGPGAYRQRSYCTGECKESTRTSAPQYSLRSRHAFGATADYRKARDEPGPANYKSNVVNPKERVAPKWSFNSNPRANKALADNGHQRNTPGPGAYKHPSSVGRQADSRKKKEAEYSFPVAPKERKRAVWQDDESPANYHHERACGRQTDSTKESLPSWTFANTARGDVKFKSQKKPGPGQYRPASAIGRQANSTKKTAPSCSFGGREKFGSPYGRFPNAWT